MTTQRRGPAISVLLCLLLAFTSGCTLVVFDMGRVRESPRRLVSVCDDGQERVVQVTYEAAVYPASQTPGPGVQLMRTLSIPHDRAELFGLCSIDDMNAGVVSICARMEHMGGRDRNRDGDFLLLEAIRPARPWDELSAEHGACDERSSLVIDETAYHDRSEGAVRTNDALLARAVKDGRVAKLSDDRLLVPWQGKVLLVRLPRRNGKRPWAKAVSIPLYPVAVATDVVLSPVYIALALIMTPLGLSV